MDRLRTDCGPGERHRGDVEAAIAAYTDDIEREMVGFPGSPHHRTDGARPF